jgi:hypothetical protein
VKYFAYGSNMSLARLRGRVSSAVSLGRHELRAHELRFHKPGRDGSAKCDAFHTGRAADEIMGVLFEIDCAERVLLDQAEGLGKGYEEKEVSVVSMGGASVEAFTYIATHIDASLRPYSWYVNHVLAGAREAGLPAGYIDARIGAVRSVEDDDEERDARERAIHR